MRTLFTIALLYSLGGCSNFTINSTACNEINTEANTQNIPDECKKYNKKEAYEAFDKEEKKKEADVESIIEFQKEEGDKK